MEELNFVEKIKLLSEETDLLSVSKDVKELRSKFEDYLLEEERKVQVEELKTEANEENPESESVTIDIEKRKEEITLLKEAFYTIYDDYKERKKVTLKELSALETSNLKEKIELINRLRDVVTTEENIGAAFSALKEIQDKWKEIGDIPREKRNSIQADYSKLLEDFFYNIKIYKELKDHDFHRNLQLKEDLIKELKKLNGVKSMKDLESKLKNLQNDWNDIGPVPNEAWDKMKEAYWTEVRSIYDKINRFYDDRRSQLQKNIQDKQALVDEVQTIVSEIESLDTVAKWDEQTNHVLEIQAKWKKVGFGPKKENEVIWKKFRTTCDAFFSAKKVFFGVVNEKFDEIADKKKVLIEQANALKISTDWSETVEKIKRLQQQWKNLGHAGGRNEQKLWKEFRGACDFFFDARQKHFAVKDKQLEENLTLKKNLIAAIEKFKLPTEKKPALEELKKFSTEFNALGLVPLKQKDSIYKSFKNAMDIHYGSLKMDGQEKDSILFEAKIETLKSSPDASRMLSEMKFDLRKEIDRQMKEITQLENNLGFFASSKGADALKKEVEKKVDQAKEKIEVIKKKLKMIPNE